MKITRDSIQNTLKVQKSNGCIRAIGVVYAFWFGLMGAGLVIGWRAGDFHNGILIGGGSLVGTFMLCGLGVGTYREQFRLDARRQTITQGRQVLFVTYLRQDWPIADFRAVDLYLYRRHEGQTSTQRFHVIRLVPNGDNPSIPRPLELGSGEAGKEMRTVAQEIAEFAGLPLRESRDYN